ncbi:MAG: CatB-related O-acetyltransferase [Galactobacter sp.]|uniref:CatB-related O-acetyltransferase n=1 Tax=Galactobacter sp. TaxID=2676125 RepID=UPI0025BDC7C7|nr:CatB-related O-acetyltransferase [Galactobacter sp.]
MPEIHDLTGGAWVLRTQKHVLSSAVTFLRDGQILGYDKAVRSRWDVQDGKLRLMDHHGKVNGVLEHREDGSYEGPLSANKAITLALIPTTWEERPRWSNLTGIHLEELASKHRWEIGDHTYGKPAVSDPRPGLTIGKFVSMDAGVIIKMAQRRTDSASSYPFQALRKWWPNGAETTDRERKHVTIGNDVRIGSRSIITAGVTIGDGAIIGEQSVVREDVPPYAIVEGVPARITGFRFDDATIQRLLAVAWWDWPDEAINEFLPLMDGDVQEFLAEAERLGL